jgi:hypothetical protein
MIGAGAGLELASLQILCADSPRSTAAGIFIQSPAKLRETFGEVAAEPAPPACNYLGSSDGRWHNLSISTVDPAYTVHGRKALCSEREAKSEPGVEVRKPD